MGRASAWLRLRAGLRFGVRLAVPMLASASVLAQTGEPAAYEPGAAPPPSERVPLRPDPPPPDPARDEHLEAVDQRIGEIESLLRRAHFRTALGVTRAALRRVGEAGPVPGAKRRRAHLELLGATAEVALGRRDTARRSLMRALRADPGLALDEADASPKVLELLREARLRTGIEEPK